MRQAIQDLRTSWCSRGPALPINFARVSTYDAVPQPPWNSLSPALHCIGPLPKHTDSDTALRRRPPFPRPLTGTPARSGHLSPPVSPHDRCAALGGTDDQQAAPMDVDASAWQTALQRSVLDQGLSAEDLQLRSILCSELPAALLLTPVPRDGNCLFTSVSLAFAAASGQYKDPGDLRSAAADFMQNRPEHFSPFVTAASDVYLTRLRQDGEWGGHDCLQALAELLSVEFVVWEPRHPCIFVRPDMPQHLCHLGYNGRNHWDAILGVDPARVMVPSAQTTGPAGVPEALTLARNTCDLEPSDMPAAAAVSSDSARDAVDSCLDRETELMPGPACQSVSVKHNRPPKRKAEPKTMPPEARPLVVSCRNVGWLTEEVLEALLEEQVDVTALWPIQGGREVAERIS